MEQRPEMPFRRNDSGHESHTERKTPYNHAPQTQNARKTAKVGWGSLFVFTFGNQYFALGGAVALAIASGLISPAFAILLGRIFDRFTKFGSNKLAPSALRHEISRFSTYLASLGVASWLLNGLFFMSWLAFGELQAKTAQGRLFKSLSVKSCAWYDTRPSGTGSLVPRVYTQIRELQLATSQPLGYVFHHTVTALASLAIAFAYCWNLTLVTLATVPLTSLILIWISRRMQPSIQAQQENLSTASKSTMTAISNIDTVKCFNGQTLETNSYAQMIAVAAVHYLAQAKANAFQIGFVRFVTLTMFVQGFWYGHHLVASGSTSTGTVITTFWSCLTATQAVEQVLPHMMVLEKGRAAGMALSRLMRQDAANSKVLSSSKPITCHGEIEMHGVSFAYPTRLQTTVLRNFRGKFHPGKTTFLVGKSGSGKSTLAQLLLKFYSATKGYITIDGQSLQSIDTSWVRQNITFVEQQSILFKGSIRDNIEIGSAQGQPTVEDVKLAAQFALLQHTISDMADGLDTVVDAGKGGLSGGQRQRMALARAWLRDTPILILDEPTSALDQVSRSLIMTAIRKWRAGRTTIIVSHDMSQIQDDDYVYVLDNGRTVQQGAGKMLDLRAEQDVTSIVKVPQIHKSTQGAETSAIVANQGRPRSQVPTDYHKSPLTRIDSDPYDNIFDEYVDTPEQKLRKSYIPSIFARAGADCGSSAGVLYSLQRQDSSQVSRTSYRNKSLSRQLLKMPVKNEVPRTRRPKLPSRGKSKTSSDDLLELVEFAGKHAMDNRLSSIRHRRLNLQDHGSCQSMASDIHGDADTEASSLSMRHILRTAWPNLTSKQRLLLFAGFSGASTHAIATPLFAWVFSRLLTTFFDPVYGARNATKWSLSIIGIAVVDAVACFLMHILLELCGQAWVDKLRTQALARILDQPKQWFAENASPATALIQSLDRDAEEMRNLLGRFAAFLLVALIMMSMAIVWCLAVCWKLTLVGLSIGPVSFAITRSFQTVSAVMESRCNDASAASASIMNEAVTNIKTVRALDLETRFLRRHADATKSALRVGLRRAFYSGFFFGLSEALIVFTNALIFYYGAVLAASRDYSINQILLVFSMLLFSMANLSAIVAFVPQIQSSKDTATRLLRLVNLPSSSHEHEGVEHLPNDEVGDIKAKDLSFTYPTSTSADPDALPTPRTLSSINLTIRAGQCTAIVGPSGSGKSTIANLLLRLYPVSPHNQRQRNAHAPAPLTLNNHPLTTLSTPHIRHHLIPVFQITVLFPTTIAQNITYPLPLSSPYTTASNISAAARAAGIHEYIASLPHGYETFVGDGGVGLSGGQVQRIGIARALVRNPGCLVLDECTSALDGESAGLVRETIKRLVRGGDGDGNGTRLQRRGMTVLMITHERAMMEMADHVIMLDRGQVVEEGTFEALKDKRGGRLARLLSGGMWDSSGGAVEEAVAETHQGGQKGYDSDDDEGERDTLATSDLRRGGGYDYREDDVSYNPGLADDDDDDDEDFEFEFEDTDLGPDAARRFGLEDWNQ